MTDERPVRAGTATDLRADGRLLTKVGTLPVLVVWHEGRPFAIEDRCPHLGFPLHQGTVEAGLVTCHWHHARFDLLSGCTLDPWADDATAFDVTIDGDDVVVHVRPEGDRTAKLRSRLKDGLEQGITLVLAKATLGLLEIDGPESIVATALDFGTTYRDEGWGAGLTVLVAMANLLPLLEPEDRPLALVQALAFVSRDTWGRAPRFPEPALGQQEHDLVRVSEWYRRFVGTRSSDAAERSLATAVHSGDLGAVEQMMFTAITDHVFIDEGHTVDFTNKAFEALALVGEERSAIVTSLVRQTCRASRSEESGEWIHPRDLVARLNKAEADLPEALTTRMDESSVDVSKLGWSLLDDDPGAVLDAIVGAVRAGATGEQLGRALAFAAALRITRFHLNNDPGDWDSVHHAFTAANAIHQALVRRERDGAAPDAGLLRGVLQGSLRVYLDRFLNVPAARLPIAEHGTLEQLAACWDVQGAVDEAGQAAWGYLRSGGSREALVAALGAALVREDAGFHWFQVVEAGARQAMAWPEGSDESALILVGVARFLAAHTPTRRELATVVRTAARLRRGEPLYADD